MYQKGVLGLAEQNSPFGLKLLREKNFYGVKAETRPITRSQAEVVGDIAIDDYMNKLILLTSDCNWHSWRSAFPSFKEPPSGYIISRGCLGARFRYDPKNDDTSGLRKMVRRFAVLQEKVNGERRAQLFDVLNAKILYVGEFAI